jgi:monoamine oxidase
MAPALVFDGNMADEQHDTNPTVLLSVESSTNGDTAKTQRASRLPERHAETGIDVLIVGAGMGGLMSALECWRKGHNVVGILERNDGPIYTGLYLQ